MFTYYMELAWEKGHILAQSVKILLKDALFVEAIKPFDCETSIWRLQNGQTLQVFFSCY